MNIIDMIIGVIILGFVAMGYKRGLLESVVRLGAFFMALFFASVMYQTVADWLVETPLTEWVYETVASHVPLGAELGTFWAINVVAAVLLVIVFTVVLNIGLSFLRIVNWIPLVGGLNRGLGALAGVGFGMLTVWTLLLVAQLFLDPQLWAGSQLMPWFSAHNIILHVLF